MPPRISIIPIPSPILMRAFSGLCGCLLYYRFTLYAFVVLLCGRDSDVIITCNYYAWLLLFQRHTFAALSRILFNLFNLDIDSVLLREYWNAIVYILHELLANRTNVFAERGREHHHLFSMWSVTENLLDVFTHICEEGDESEELANMQLDQLKCDNCAILHQQRCHL